MARRASAVRTFDYVIEFFHHAGVRETIPLRAADQFDAISVAKLCAVRTGHRDFQVRAVAGNVHTLIYRSNSPANRKSGPSRRA